MSVNNAALNGSRHGKELTLSLFKVKEKENWFHFCSLSLAEQSIHADSWINLVANWRANRFRPLTASNWNGLLKQLVNTCPAITLLLHRWTLKRLQREVLKGNVQLFVLPELPRASKKETADQALKTIKQRLSHISVTLVLFACRSWTNFFFFLSKIISLVLKQQNTHSSNLCKKKKKQLSDFQKWRKAVLSCRVLMHLLGIQWKGKQLS